MREHNAKWVENGRFQWQITQKRTLISLPGDWHLLPVTAFKAAEGMGDIGPPSSSVETHKKA
jgi:hypothetical protein